MRVFARVLVAALICPLAAGAVYAQSSSAGIEGTVTDDDGRALPAVRVAVSSPEMQGTRTAITDQDGDYRFVLLPPGTYRAVFTLSGYRTVEQENVRIGLETVITIKVALHPTSMDEVVVRGDAPMVDVTSTAIGSAFSRRVIDNVPVGRDVTSLTFLAAGVVDGGGLADERLAGNPSIMGGSALENRTVVDGLDTTDPGDGRAGTRISSSFVAELQVGTGGWEAEHRGALGGVVDMITGSGGNELHGDVFGYLTNDALTSGAKIPRGRGDSRTPDTGWDVGFTLGGKVVEDTLWYFIAWDPSRLEQNVRKDVFRGSEVYQSNRFRRTSQRESYAAKLTWRLNPSNSIVAHVLGDPTRVTNDVSDTSTNWIDSPLVGKSDMTTDPKRGGVNFGLRWSSALSDTFFLEGAAGHHRNQDQWVANLDTTSYQDQTGTGLWTDGVGGEVFFGGAGFQQPGDERTRDQLRASLTWLLGETHEVKTGAMYERLEVDVDSFMTGPSDAFCSPTVEGGALQYDPATGLESVIPNDCDTSGDGILDGVMMPSRLGSSYRLRPGEYDLLSSENRSTGTTTELGLYLQDSWRLADNLTVNIGLRAESSLSTGDLTEVIPERKLDFALGDIITPRLGLVWDPTSSGRSKVYAHYGTLYQALPLDLNTRWFGNRHDDLFFSEYPVNGLPSTANPGALASVYRSSSVLTLVDPNLKPEVLEEVVLGGDYEVMTNLEVGITYVSRRLRRAIEGISVDEGQTILVTNPGGTYVANPTTGVPLDTPVTFPRAVRDFDGVELSLDKRYSDRVQLYASLMWSRLEGNDEGLASRDNRQTGPDVTSSLDLPDLLEGGYGPLPNDRTWQVKAYGSYLFRCGLTAGFNFFHLTGTPVSKLGAHRIYGLDERFVTPRGSEGRTPGWSNLDLHLSYPVPLGDNDLEVLLDVFNLFDTQVAVVVDQRWTVYAPGDEDVAPGGDVNTQTNPDWSKPLVFSDPRNIRIGLKLSW